eukprot:Gregarina_sp_Poly_1__5189@NODE_274_length_10212_cov_70_754460_g239_i0_p9_GENE_NODE_274_length_10212_cov_70_754460_g239_i0NODE_274_length_10212_cov_70_754460_g239_i0_p9_ORF_typecomplete_len151_score18_49_NODE_274_length_10212_cov_70_754460_g239_i048945346
MSSLMPQEAAAVAAASHNTTFATSSLPSVSEIQSDQEFTIPQRLQTGPLFDKDVLNIVQEAARLANMTPLEERNLLYHCWKQFIRSRAVLQHAIANNVVHKSLLPHEATAMTLAAKNLFPLTYGEIEGPRGSEIKSKDGGSHALLMYSIK